MHTYCGGCFSQWMKTSKSCPTCRKRATSVAQNHILRNLIDVYLKTNPGRCNLVMCTISKYVVLYMRMSHGFRLRRLGEGDFTFSCSLVSETRHFILGSCVIGYYLYFFLLEKRRPAEDLAELDKHNKIKVPNMVIILRIFRGHT